MPFEADQGLVGCAARREDTVGKEAYLGQPAEEAIPGDHQPAAISWRKAVGLEIGGASCTDES